MNGDSRKRDRRDFRSFSRQEELESKLGFNLISEGEKKLGRLLTFSPSSWEVPETSKVYGCVDLYFVALDGTEFQVSPLLLCRHKGQNGNGCKYESQVADIEIMEKEDLDLFLIVFSGVHVKRIVEWGKKGGGKSQLQQFNLLDEALDIYRKSNCAGSYRCREDESEFRSKMQIFLKVAECQKFRLLQECTSPTPRKRRAISWPQRYSALSK